MKSGFKLSVAVSYLVHLRSFIRVFQTGSVKAAARQINLTQPAVTTHIKALEQHVGRPLFVRAPRGMIPTPAGLDLAKRSMAHVDALESVLEATARRTSDLKGTVHIVGPGEYLSSKIAPVVPYFLREDIDIRFKIGDRSHIYRLLENKDSDIGVIASPPMTDTHDFVPIDSEKLVLIASPTIAEQLYGAKINPSALINAPFVAYDETLPLINSYLDRLFGGVPGLRPSIVAPDLRLLRELVASGAGWSVLPDYLCAGEIDKGRLVRVDLLRPAIENTIYLTWLKGTLSPVVAYVRDYIVSNIQNDHPA